MEPQNSFRKVVGWLTIISVPFAIANFVLTSVASVAASAETIDFSDLGFFVNAGIEAGNLMKWAWLADLFGYYLLLVPAAFFIHYWLKSKNPYWMNIITYCGVAYLFAGSMGAAILARIFPSLISGYTGADGAVKEIYRIVFTNSAQMVNGGIWGYFEFLLAGIWWIGIGFTMRQERNALGVCSIILGISSILAAFGHIFDLYNVANLGLVIYLMLSPVWACWLGISLIQGKKIQLSNP
ncbi:MAG: hypothetical protein JEY91_16255 [Spirochaetaceae bacterium]|nr:hypothetical protein [Spirochaetaceae bacterium]